MVFLVVVVVEGRLVVVVVVVVVVAFGVVMGILTDKSSRTTSGLESALGGGIPVTRMGFRPLLTVPSSSAVDKVVEVKADEAEAVEAVVLGVSRPPSTTTSSKMGLFHKSPAPDWRNHGGRGRLVVVAATRGAQA